MSRTTQGGAEPDEELGRLDKLVGRWTLSGDTTGSVTYEWMDGRFFLLQRVDMTLAGHRTVGLEVIGRLMAFGADGAGDDICSRFYGSQGETFDYVYEISDDGEALTIWGGEKGSPAYYRGRFNDEGTENTGAWVYPDGGGYASTMTKVG